MEVKELIEKMKEGIVEFKYRKCDGSIRVAHGTLQSSFFPEFIPKNPIRSIENVVTYWDTDKCNWRSFKRENII